MIILGLRVFRLGCDKFGFSLKSVVFFSAGLFLGFLLLVCGLTSEALQPFPFAYLFSASSDETLVCRT